MPDLRSRVLCAGYRGLARPVLFRLGGGEAEDAHHLTVRAAAGLGRSPAGRAVLRAAAAPVADPVDLLGLRFANRVGLAAGMDKDGVAVPAWEAIGFGHVELGTVTPRPQPGNRRPRLIRLPRSRAVVNRMGFNNAGVGALAARLAAMRAGGLTIPVGVSIGRNKATPEDDAVADYLACVDRMHGLADYLAVNVSSPNTPGLRGLQDPERLSALLASVVGRTRALADPRPVPVLVKLAPDLPDPALEEAVEVAVGAGVAGFIATNTTTGRSGTHPREQRRAVAEAGGMSGAPLTGLARQVVARVRARTDLPLIGVGGIMSADDAWELVRAGADLVQVYTGLVYAGPGLVREVAAALRPR